ncbi:multicopper oxidase domain-containing protein [Micromonospora sp. NPDC006766]|uniref:multicopper oxidase domain-containing protein n=1 Tax=Micromonospora sp. NPDC006766 TaxID=3154778 RepID=UPI003411B8C1
MAGARSGRRSVPAAHPQRIQRAALRPRGRHRRRTARRPGADRLGPGTAGAPSVSRIAAGRTGGALRRRHRLLLRRGRNPVALEKPERGRRHARRDGFRRRPPRPGRQPDPRRARPRRADVHHPVHIHLVGFRILSCGGRAPLPHDGGLKDTVALRPGESVEVITRFEGTAAATSSTATTPSTRTCE